MSDIVSFSSHGKIGLIAVNSPPVNALSHAVRKSSTAAPTPPRIVSKYDEEEQPLLLFHGEFESDIIARALVKRLSQKARIESADAWIERLDEIHSRSKVVTLARSAYCSGCPHNSSTTALPGSVVSAGIGCHTMAMWMNRNVVMGTHMGAEGAQ